MNLRSLFRSRATALWRALSVLVVVAGAVTCDSPTAFRQRVSLAFAPRLGKLSMSGFSGMTVDSVRLTVVRPPSDTVATQTLPFSPDSATISASITVSLSSGHEQLLVLIDFLSSSQVVFTGVDTVDVLAGLTSQAPAQVPISYTGPGKNIKTIHITPRDSGVTFGSQAQFVITATDSSNNNVPQFYVSWSTTRAGDTINAAGLFRPGLVRGISWVRAHTPSGIWDSTRIAVTPVANQITVVSGDHQAAALGQVLPNQLVVQVKAADNLPVVGAPVQFVVTAGGGSVFPPVVATDTTGKAATTVTLGSSLGPNTIAASIVGAASVATSSTDTALGQHGVAATLTKVAGDAQSATAGTAVSVAPQVVVKDAFGAVVSGVSVAFTVQSGGGSVTGGTATSDVNGLAAVGSWTLGATAGANTLRAAIPSLPAVSPVTFTATGTAGASIQLSVPGNLIGMGSSAPLLVKLVPAPSSSTLVTVTSDSTQYVTVAAPGTVSFGPGDTLKTINLNGIAVGGSIIHATATGYTAGLTGVGVTPDIILMQTPLTVAVGQNVTDSIHLVPAAPTGGLVITFASTDSTIAKTTTAQVTIPAGQAAGAVSVHGVAAGTVGITGSATGYATGGSVVTVGVAGQAATLTKFTGDNQTAQVGTAVSIAPAVKVTDALGSPVQGTTVTFAVVTGGGSVTGASATSNSSGVATVGSWTLGGTAGSNTLMASSGSLTPVVFTATGAASSIASTVVSPHSQTLNAFGQTFQLTAQAKDASNNNIAGNFTWVSRTPATATVDATGKVTSVANGTSYVVATEAGGTKDSSLITVTQTLASIVVTPGTRSIYLTRNFTFTAQGVDGLGHPVPGITSFTWSTTAPAVATVDTTVHTATNLVNAIALGSAQIKATANAVTGVSNVSVITPITRIAVVVDTVGAAKTDTFSLASLGLTRRYRAIAHDTLDAAMTGINFNWVSTNGAVATLDSTANRVTSTATSVANGVTSIQATAQGFTSNPGALLNVSQVLSSVELSAPQSNPGAIIAISGTVNLIARGKDANNRYIAGGTFSYASATTSVATVDAVTGVVTGVSNGTSNITATSAAITSNNLLVTVGGAVPSIISFGRDTISVGRGGSAQIPILLSKPALVALTVNLTATAFAHWSTASISIPAGATSGNAQLNGDSAGTTTVTATDGSSQGYTAGSAVARVTANMHFASGSYAINTTDIVTTQVQLSDPSPAGGTFVTFSYSTPGIAKVSPDPAFIPAGQLAADIQILAVSAGTTTMTPSAIGVNGQSASFTAYAPVLTPSTSQIVLGQGQYEAGYYVYTPTYTNLPVPVTIASSDTNLVTASSPVTIPAANNYVYFTTSAKGIGSASLTFSAPGWTQAHGVTVVSSTPAVGMCCSNSGLFTTSPQQGFTVYSEDSTRSLHPRTNSLLVHMHSTDTTVIKVLDTVLTIQPGLYYNNSGRFVVGANPGTAYIVATASGHTSDSSAYTVSGPPLNLSWGGTPRVGAGQQDINAYYVYIPNAVASPLVVTLTSSDTTILTVPATVTIPTGNNYQYFSEVGKAPGAVTIHAAAPGYNAVTGNFVVTSPILGAAGGGTLTLFGSSSAVYAYSEDSTRGGHVRVTPLTVSVVSTDPSVITVDSSSVTIPAGQYYTVAPARVTPVSAGTAKIIFTAAGHPTVDTLVFTVVTPQVHFNTRNIVLGRRQHAGTNSYYVYTPNSRTVAVPTTIVQLHNSLDTLTSTALTIAANTNYTYFDVWGLQTGKDTLILSATGYLPDTAFVTVTTPRFVAGGIPGSLTTTNPPFTAYVYATDSLQNSHYVLDTIVVAAVPSDSTVIQPFRHFFRIPKEAYYAADTVIVTGPGTSNITFTDSAGTGYGSVTTNSVTVTGPSLTLANGSSRLGMRQHGGANSSYVYVPNNPVTPLVVNLISTDPTVATVPASVTIPTNANYAYFDVTAKDVTGTIQIQASATGYGGASMNVQVTQPRFEVSTSGQINTTSASQTITVYAEDASGGTHPTTEDVSATLLSSLPSVANVDSSTVTIVAGNYYTQAARWSPGIVGTAQITASDARAAVYKYNSGSANVAVVTPSLNFAGYPGVLGLGQYNDNVYAYTPDAAAAPISVAFTHTGTARTGTFTNGTNTPITGVTIATATNYTYFRMSGLVRGTDTLVASATSPTHNPATIYTVVDSGRVDPINNWPGSIKVGDSVLVTMYAYDLNQNTHYEVAATQFTLAPTNIEFHVGGATVTTVTIPANAYYVQFYLVGKTAGTGSVTITNANYKTYTTTVTVTP